MRPAAELRVPADTAYVAVLRMTSAGIAARLDFTLEDIEDLRMAVGEACALILDSADEKGSLLAAYTTGPGSLRIEVSAETAASGVAARDEESFAWQVLSTLAKDLRSEESDGRHTIGFTVTSTLES